MTLSEDARVQDWMSDWVELVEPSMLIQRLQELLQSKEYIALAQQHKQKFMERPMIDCLQPVLAELSGRMS
jgi:hypothetical protein